MKKISTLIISLICFVLITTAQDDTPDLDSATAVSFPWYNNNQYLIDYLNNRGYYGGSQFRTSCPTARYLIPLKVHVYRNNAGNVISNLDQVAVETLISQVNALFLNTNSDIQFYITDIEFKNNESNRTGIDNFFETSFMFSSQRVAGALNLHLVRSSNFTGLGYAITPFIPSTQISNINSIKWSCYVETAGNNIPSIASTTAHELGHTLGLLHTHHPGRVISLAFNEENATISNGCYQEMVSRSRENKFVQGCFATDGDKKCEINGDFLCDTDADPGSGFEDDGNGVTLKEVTGINDNPSCSYQNYNFGSDYNEDNDNDAWTPPVHNLMSYSTFTCQNEFTPMQIGQMWYYIEEDFGHSFEGVYSGNTAAICTSGNTITLTNPPPGMNLSWSVTPTSLIHSTTRTGSGSSAFIRAASPSSSGKATIFFQEENDCNYFNSEVEIWIGKPSGLNPDDVSGPACVVVPSTVQYFVEPWPTYYSDVGASDMNISWAFGGTPSGVNFTKDPNRLRVDMTTTSSTALNQSYTFSIAATNQCGAGSASFVTFQTKSSSQGCGGGKGTFSFLVSPNPTSDQVNITFEDTEDMASYFVDVKQPLKVEIINPIAEIKYRGVINKNGLTVDLSKMEPGLYLVRVTGKDYKQTARLIIE